MSQPQVLLIEDNGADVFILKRCLEQHAHDVEIFVLSDGEQAIEYVQHTHRDSPHPCVIVVDLHLPRYDGLEVLTAIRATPTLSHVQVVVVTGAATPSEKDAVESLGAHFRNKPSSLTECEALAQELIALCKGQSTAAA